MSGRRPPGYMRLHGQQHQYPALSRTELTEDRERRRRRRERERAREIHSGVGGGSLR